MWTLETSTFKLNYFIAQKPRGRLMTKFIIDLVGPLMHLRSGSASSNGRPRGLVAVAMAAVCVVFSVLLLKWAFLTELVS